MKGCTIEWVFIIIAKIFNIFLLFCLCLSHSARIWTLSPMIMSWEFYHGHCPWTYFFEFTKKELTYPGHLSSHGHLVWFTSHKTMLWKLFFIYARVYDRMSIYKYCQSFLTFLLFWLLLSHNARIWTLNPRIMRCEFYRCHHTWTHFL